VPGTQTIAELSTLTVTNTASDADLPANTLTFSLVSAPSGMTINPSSGVLTWTPSEAQSPGTNLITVKVTDNGAPPASDTKSFTVIVTEANSAPVLTVPGTQTIAELSTLTVTNTASDADLPANTLTFSLVSAPSGMTINPSSGVVTWTPTEAQGPSTNLITVKVTDNGAPPASDTKSFTVIVTESNSAPVLTVPGTQTIAELSTLTVTNTASDADLRANTLTFSLVSAPSGMTINPSSGVVTWTPTEAQGPSTNLITVKVTDNGAPPASDTKSFTVIVTEANTAPVLTVPGTQTIAELSTLTVTNTASDADLPANTLTFSLVSAPSGVTINPSSGVFTWTPTEAQGPSTNLITVKVTDNGAAPASDTKSFTVIVTEANTAPVLTVPGTQTIAELSTLTVTNTASDADLPANTLTFSLVSAPSGMTIDPSSGVLTWTPTEAQSPSTNLITVKVTDNGAPPASDTKSFTVIVAEANTAPVLTVPGTQTIAELSTLTVTNTASDADVPANTLTFSLVSTPSGMTIDPSSGVLTWTPTEAQGPSTNLITVKVTDNGATPASDTRSFTVIVTESNSAPVLTVPGTQTIAELSTLTVTNTASDADLPANTLTFSLVSAPSGMAINPSSGVLTWTPTEVQGPSTNLITVKVTDNGAPPASDTKSFTVIVTEANTAPVLTVPGTQTIAELSTLTVTNTASDADLPANTLTFSLVSAPNGMTIDPSSGVVTWTPTEAQGPSTNLITVKVTDNGAPPASDTKSFTVIVTDANSAPVLTVPGTQTIAELSTLTVTNTASDADLPANTLTFSLVSAPSGMTINPSSGVVTWTPTEDQGPSTNLITVKVTDNGAPPASDTRSFTVIVTEANSAPVLTVPGTQTIAELSTLTVTNTASDADLPANTLTFSLVSAPSGMTINPSSGVVTWTPTEAQGPSTNLITVKVTDNGAPPSSDIKAFTVIVTEGNTAPVLSPVGDRIAFAGIQLTVTNSAIDRDGDVLTFSLDPGAPAGAVIDPATGRFTWTPPIDQAPGTNVVVVRVTDGGVPGLSDTKTFNIVVGSPPVIESIVATGGNVTITWSAMAGQTYRVQFKSALNDPAWSDLAGDVIAAGTTATKTDSMLSEVQRSYRVVLVPQP
jgi:hypothetical protein